MSSSESGGRVSSCQVAVENQDPLPPPFVPMKDMPRDGVKPLSGKAYFHVIISKSHLNPRYAVGPSGKIDLPSEPIPTVLNCRGKSWNMIYNGQNKTKQFDTIGWRNFAKDNHLDLGDACVFDLVEKSKEKLVFEVQILRCDFPCESPGVDESEEDPVVLSKFLGTGEIDAPFVID